MIGSLRFAVALTLTVAAAAPALAATRTFPGGTCQKYSGGTLAVDSNFHAENTGTSTLYLLCPMAVDDVTTESADAAVFVTDLSNTAGVCCESRAKNTSGSYYTGGSSCTSTSGYSSSYGSVSPVVPDVDYTFTHRYFYCSVPHNAGLGTSEVRTFRW